MANNCTDYVIKNWKNNNERMEWDLDALIGTVTFATHRIMDLLDLPNDTRPLTGMDDMQLADNEHVPKAIENMDKALENIHKRHDKHNKAMRYCTGQMQNDLRIIFDNSEFIQQAAMRAFKPQYLEEWGGAFEDYIAIIRTALEYLDSMKFMI